MACESLADLLNPTTITPTKRCFNSLCTPPLLHDCEYGRDNIVTFRLAATLIYVAAMVLLFAFLVENKKNKLGWPLFLVVLTRLR